MQSAVNKLNDFVIIVLSKFKHLLSTCIYMFIRVCVDVYFTAYVCAHERRNYE